VAIKTFRDKATEAIFNGKFAKAFGPDVSKIALRKLTYLHAVRQLDQLRVPPANQLETLKGDRLGQHSIRVNDQFRICFRWREGDAYDVELVDYH
jgi:proteic killer suppression protein